MNHLPSIISAREIKRLAPLIAHDKASRKWLTEAKPCAREIARAIRVELAGRGRSDILLNLKRGWAKAMKAELEEEIRGL